MRSLQLLAAFSGTGDTYSLKGHSCVFLKLYMEGAFGFVFRVFGCTGFGKAHTLAFSDLKKSRMLSYRYICRSMSNPGEIVGFLFRRLNWSQRKLKLCMLFIHTHREMIELSYVLQWFKETTNKLPPELCEWWLVLLVHQQVAVHCGHFWKTSVLMPQLLLKIPHQGPTTLFSRHQSGATLCGQWSSWKTNDSYRPEK